MRVIARRNRIREARSGAGRCGRTPIVAVAVEQPGGRCGWHRVPLCWGRAKHPQYHQSHQSHAAATRRPGCCGSSGVVLAAGLDLGLAGQPVGPTDLGLAHPACLAGVSGRSAGMGRGCPSASIATNTKYAELTCSVSPEVSFQGWVSIRTPISIDERPVQLTWAKVCTMSPTWTGCRNAISSMAAVTEGPALCRCATAPAVESASFIISPPWMLPSRLADCGPISTASETRAWDGGSGTSSVMEFTLAVGGRRLRCRQTFRGNAVR